MTNTEFYTKPQVTPEREEYYRRLAKRNAGPLWEVLAELVPKEPHTPCVPAHWSYEEMRPLIMEAGGLITEKEAERRVLILENPGIKGTSCITETLYAGLQLVLPGEEAPTHRHTSGALRLVLEGSNGGYTAVEGERATMQAGDFIVTPSWTYHDHGNPGNCPVIWMDILDLPMVNYHECGFAEHHPMEIQPVLKGEGDSLARYGANLVPVDYQPTRSTPTFHYPYSRSRETLHRMHKEGPVHACHGVKMRFVNPANGGAPMPMIGTYIQLLPAGFHGQPYRATDATIYSVIEGRGHSRIGDTTIQWKERDIFVVPSWHPVSHHVDTGDAVLFSGSDRPVQQAFGIWREKAPALG